MKERDPRVIKNISKSIKNVDERVWKESIEELITPVLYDKFEQNPHLLEWLRSTERRELVEAAGPHDRVWGNGLNLNSSDVEDMFYWTGVNKQGSMLMKVRKLLCPELYPESDSSSKKNVSFNLSSSPEIIQSTQAFELIEDTVIGCITERLARHMIYSFS